MAGENGYTVGVIQCKMGVDEDDDCFEDSGERKGVREMGP
jgi:hypothetical protein